MYDDSEVMRIILSAAERTSPFRPLAAASLISGIKRVESAPRRVDGKNKIGNAIPFIIPNCESASEEDVARQIGTSRFSLVRKSEFKYLPEVIGSAICFIALSML